MQEIYLGRQPIYDPTLKVEGFELFGTAQVVLNTFAERGLRELVGEHIAFINITHQFLLSGHLKDFLNPQIVFEIAGINEADEQMIPILHELRRQGQRFVLDHYVDNEANRALLEVVDYVKLDVLTTAAEELRRLVPFLRQQRVALMAERIEHQDVFDACQALKFDYFQGYHFSQPKLIKFQRVPSNRLAVLQLISKLHDPQVTPKEIESLIVQDVSLSYKLLRHINSAYFNLPRRIESIQRAILLLGVKNIRTWATFISLANVEVTRSDLITIALVRAYMCEQLATAKGLPQQESSFTVGLLSVLEVLTQSPLEEILATLALAEELNHALLRHEGPLGRILACTLAYERCDWDDLDTLGLEPNQVSNAYMAALSDAYRVTYEFLDQKPKP